MKHLTTVLATLTALSLNTAQAQVPEALNYQAALRDATGAVLTNHGVTVQLTIHENGPAGPTEYQEHHTTTTSSTGLIHVQIGTGTATAGTFDGIDWANTDKWLQVEVDQGTGFTDMGAQRLLSVPYALLARDVVNDPDADSTNEIQNLSLEGNELSITGGNTVILPWHAQDIPGNGNGNGNTLDESYDEGGPGAGRVIIADSGAVHIQGADGLHVDGMVGIGTTSPTSALHVAGPIRYDHSSAGIDKVLTSTDAFGNAVWQTPADPSQVNELNTGANLSGTQLNITDAGGTLAVDLSSLENDADPDPTNELNTGANLSGTMLNITDAGGTLAVDLNSLGNDADADPTNEMNTGASLSGTMLNITDAGGTLVVDLNSLGNDADADPTNELQMMSVSGSTSPSVDLSNGGGNVLFEGAGATTLSRSGNMITISSTDSNTVYTAGTGLSLTGTEFTNTGDVNASDDITTSSTAGGDLTGPFSNLQIAPGAVGATELSTSGVIAGSYGSSTTVPSFTVDEDGRITTVTNVGIAASGDNLGNHTATTTLNVNGQLITNIGDAFNAGWYRNNAAGTGLYNQATGRHFYSESSSYWTVASGNGMVFRNGHAGDIAGYVYWDGPVGAHSFGLLSPSGNWRVRVDNSNVEIHAPAYMTTAYCPILYDRDNVDYYLDMNNSSNFNVTTANESYTDGWFRVNGTGGLYWQAYGGGFVMQDGTWIRAYGNKPILATAGLAGYGNAVFGTQYGGSPRIYANYDNATGGGLAIADDGGFYDFNDGWIDYRGSTGLRIVTNNTSWALLVNMFNASGGGPYDKRVASGTNSFGLMGASDQAWWQMWSYSYNNASERELKKDIAPVTDALKDLVMRDLDELTPYLYRYNVETDEWVEGMEAKYRPGLHMGLITDDAPDYVQAQSFQGVDIYAVATLGVAASKYNREDIKQIKTALGMDSVSTVVHDFGSADMTGNEVWVEFSPAFASQLKSGVPVITVTPHQAGAQLSVTERNSSGFKVVNSANGPVSFDYILMARVAIAPVESAPQDVVSRMYVDEATKARVRAYWDAQAGLQKAAEQLAASNAGQIQKERAAVLNNSTKP